MIHSKNALKLMLVLGLAFSAVAHADPAAPSASPTATPSPTNDEDSLMVPYIAPSETCPVIVPPDNASDYLFSKDCKTLFVYPPIAGTRQVTGIAPEVTYDTCAAFENIQKGVNVLSQEQLYWNEQSAKETDPGTQTIDLQRAQSITAQIKNLYGEFSGMEGATVQVAFTSGFNESFINKWIELNLMAVSQGLRIVPAPISQSLYSFTPVAAANPNTMPNILSLNIPGIQTTLGTNTVIGGEALGGQLVLSVNGACSYADMSNPIGLVTIKPDAVNQFATVNRSYSIPVLSGVGFTASLNVVNAIKTLGSSQLIKGQFSEEDLQSTFASGGVSDAFFFHYKDLGSASQSDATATPAPQGANDPIEKLRADVLADFTDRMAKHLVMDGVIQLASVTQAPDTVNGGFTQQQGTQTVCHSVWIFGQSCHNQVYEIPVWNDGISNREIKQAEDTQFTISEDVDIDTTIYKTGTQKF